jgi:hypothetical protein
MVYVYYNLRLLVRQIQKTPDVDAILLDGINTSVEWRVESERPILESMPDWIQQEVEGAVAEGGGGGGGECYRAESSTIFTDSDRGSCTWQ